MSFDQAVVALVAAVVGVLVGALTVRRRLAHPDRRLVRVNVEGRNVPAVLGDGVGAGALAAVAVVTVVDRFVEVGSVRMAVAVATVTGLLYAAGRFDDLRGDELPRGFKGHLSAAGRGRLTGGLVKIGAGLSAGLVAGLAVSAGWGVVETAVLVALGANLLNLLDRAPGRAGKVGLGAAVPLVALGSPNWAVESAGLLGAVLFCLPLDLRARGMLGDAGANPLGGVLGLGVAASLGATGRGVALVVLVLLNGLSERYSFSRAIEATPPLRWVDGLGRRSADRDREK